MSGENTYPVESTLVAIGVLILVLYLVRRVLERGRPHLLIWQPLMVGATLRVGALLVLGSSGVGSSLRGDDEPFLIAQAQAIAHHGSGLGELAINKMHLFVASQEFAFGMTVDGVRIIQVLFTLMGVALIATAAYDLGGPKAGHLAAWLLALEPANIFFSSVIHKEPFMYLATGLVVLGCTRVWVGLGKSGPLMMIAGCALAVTVRAYAGWFLAGSCLVLMMHASLRHASRRPVAALPFLVAGGVAMAIGLGPALSATSGDTLKQLQISQNANATDTSNLKLEPVDFSSRSSAIAELPKRIRDVLFKPYPWQVHSFRQQVGLLGTFAALITLFLLLRYAWFSAGALMSRLAPMFYPSVALLIAFSLSAGNAGTSFRYRTNLIAMALAAVAVLRTRVLASAHMAKSGRESPPGLLASGLGAGPRGHRLTPVRRSLPDSPGAGS